MNFQEAFSHVLAAEGGYSNDPADAGGETYKGIARKKNPTWSGWAIVDVAKQKPGFPKSLDTDAALTEAVKGFYRVEYWDKCRCDDMPDEIRFELFDTAVNQGVGQAIMNMQRALNLLNKEGKEYPDLKVDGGIGPMTITAARTCKNRKALYLLMNIIQGARYVAIAEGNQTNERFIAGWVMNRCSTDHYR